MKTEKLKNGDKVQVKADPNGEGWVIDGRQTGSKTGQVYENGDEITSELRQQNMPTKAQLLKEAGLTIRKNPVTGLFKINLYSMSGAEKCNQTIGHYGNRESAIEAAADCAIDRFSFTRVEWEAAK